MRKLQNRSLTHKHRFATSTIFYLLLPPFLFLCGLNILSRDTLCLPIASGFYCWAKLYRFSWCVADCSLHCLKRPKCVRQPGKCLSIFAVLVFACQCVLSFLMEKNWSAISAISSIDVEWIGIVVIRGTLSMNVIFKLTSIFMRCRRTFILLFCQPIDQPNTINGIKWDRCKHANANDNLLQNWNILSANVSHDHRLIRHRTPKMPSPSINSTRIEFAGFLAKTKVRARTCGISL